MSDLREFLNNAPLERLARDAAALRDLHFGATLTYSRKVFVPLTQLCRDVCHYCTFAKAPSRLSAPYLDPGAVLAIVEAGRQAGCKEVLFTLGDKPELRYPAARQALDEFGFATTLDYLAMIAKRVLNETGLLPHINAGVMTLSDYQRLKSCAASMGIMLESASARLCERGGPHFGSPDKDPQLRLASIEDAGRAGVPLTSGLLIGIGETRAERLDALYALQAIHARHGHLQELIIQNFRAKPGTPMAGFAEPPIEELVWTIAAARLIFGNSLSIQAPPNLNPGQTAALIAAGIDDWGGISPVTIDHVNPEAAWPEIAALAEACAEAGHVLTERLTVYPNYILDRGGDWFDKSVATKVYAHSDSGGLAREDLWSPGVADAAPPMPARLARPDRHLNHCLNRIGSGSEPDLRAVTALFAARGPALGAVIEAADGLRHSAKGDDVTFVVNRNINYTNICTYHCSFCAFSKSSSKLGLRDQAYLLDLAEIERRTLEAHEAGATEVCLQGGIHPDFTGRTYLEICRAVKRVCPTMHVHAFSPLEIHHGASTLGLSVARFLNMLKDEGLGSLPGTAAEILCDDVRAVICPDKLSADQWLAVIADAHRVGLATTSTIMFGHVDDYTHWAEHILLLRRLQQQTGGFTEFVPLPFVHMQSPVFVKGLARKGPSWRESILMHAVARIVLSGSIDNIQASWVKLGLDGAAACLKAGVNDLGGVLMNESISRAAGAAHGQEVTIDDLRKAARSAGRSLRQRSTLYRGMEMRAPADAA